MKITLKIVVICMAVVLFWGCAGMTEDFLAKAAAAQAELDKSEADQKAERIARIVAAEVGIARGNVARTGVYPSSGIIPKGNLKWRFKLGREEDLKGYAPLELSTPVILKDKVYVSGIDGILYCLDFNTGKEIWTTKESTGGNRGSLSPTVIADHFTFGTFKNKIDLFHPERGFFMFDIKISSGGGSPVVADNMLFFAVHRHIYAYSIVPSKKQLWSYFAPSYGGFVTYDQGVIYFAYKHGVLALDAKSGELKWDTAIPTVTSNFNAIPVIANGALYLSDDSGQTYAIDIVTGNVKWSFKPMFADVRTANTVAVMDSTVYVSTNMDEVIFLDAETGNKITVYGLWDNFGDRNHQVAPSSFADGVGYFADDAGKIKAWGLAARKQLWTFTTDGSIKSAPAIYEGVVFVTSTDGYIYAIE